MDEIRDAILAGRLEALGGGLIHPTLSKVYAMEDVGQAASDVHHDTHQGKVGVLTLAPGEGLGVRDTAKRERHLEAIDRFRGV